MSLKQFAVLVFFCFFFIPRAEAATAPFEISGWIPSWQSASGTAEALTHLNTFTEINPFGYGVASDGTLIDSLGMNAEPWTSFVKTAQKDKVRIVPTVTWADGAAIDHVLESPTLRAAHIKAIVNLVYSHGFDGIDIDYENKEPATTASFAIFMHDLYAAMGNKWVECDVEPEYDANYIAYSKYCDRVKLMAYDEHVIDHTLSTLTSIPYAPIADPQWVEQSILVAEKIIPKNKLVVGIATYGYEYQVSELSSGYDYRLISAFNPNYATALAAQLHITPTRNSAGELSFAYAPQATSLHLLWWSDASAIKDKVDLAKSLGIRGVAIFKIDGGADPGLWNVLKQ
jgi:spore germination protein YaaH